jgi:acetolactate synthase regulatory subunit
MRQLGRPPAIDLAMNTEVVRLLRARGFEAIDADASTGSKDYLERILGLIRGTGFTVALFSHQTRHNSMANISLELGFAAMCGKPLIIVKSPEAVAPSDLKRTDWIEYDERNVMEFRRKLGQALDEIERLFDWENDLLQASFEARSPDCAVGLERANKGFLVSGREHFIGAAERILAILDRAGESSAIADLERLRIETRTFISQARAALPTPLGRAITSKRRRSR